MITLVSNSTGCVHFAIGLDGVFLEEPFSDERYFMMPGTRLDLAVMCTEYGNHDFALIQADNSNWMFRGVDYAEDITLFQLNARADTPKNVRSIEEWTAPMKPEYLSDLVNLPESEIEGRFGIQSVLSMDSDNFVKLNDVFWKGRNESVLFELKVGKVYEIEFTSSYAVHPIHWHVNHMQVVWDKQNLDSTNDNSWPIHRIGTWRDTVFTSRDRGVVFRIRPESFSGLMLVHCHYIIHADRGMMAEIRLVDSVDSTQ